MRLVAVAKKGFYPLAPECAGLIASRLKCTDGATIFDPCAGYGDAVARIAASAGISPERISAAELDERRADICKQRIPLGIVSGPVDFLGARLDGEASVAYINPPFDDELGGGGRVEMSFIDRGLRCLVTDGVMILVLPERVAQDNRLISVIRSRCNSVQGFYLPEKHRKYGEVVLFGRKLKRERNPELMRWCDLVHPRVEHLPIYPVPRGGMVTVTKQASTDQELMALLSNSEAKDLLKPSKRAAKRTLRPPTDLRKGHIAMLLASGCLDGVVAEADGSRHIVRGTSRKVIEKKEVDDGDKVKVIETEQILLTVKVALPEGKVIELTSKVDHENTEIVEIDEEEEQNG